MRPSRVAAAVLAVALLLVAFAVRHERVALAADEDEAPEVGAIDMKGYLANLQAKARANYVVCHGARSFVIHSVLEDCVILYELEMRDGEPLETSDSTLPEDRVKAIWKHGRNEPNTFRRIATWMVPFSSVQRVDYKLVDGRKRFRIQLVGVE